VFFLRSKRISYRICSFACFKYIKTFEIYLGSLLPGKYIIKGLYRYINIKEKISFKKIIILIVLYALLFTLVYSFDQFYYRNILNALYPMVIYIIIPIEQLENLNMKYHKILTFYSLMILYDSY
jgi:hypothetical protein